MLMKALRITVTITLALLFLFSCTFPPQSVGGRVGSDDEGRGSNEQGKMVLGSKPPRCVNKCMSCNPCTAAVVVPHHYQRKKDLKDQSAALTREGDGSYYLLSWKCRCGNHLFHP